MRGRGALVTSVKVIDIGRAIRVDYGKGNVNNRLLHIRGIVDGHMICRRWSRTKQRWVYEMLHPGWFNYNDGAYRWARLSRRK